MFFLCVSFSISFQLVLLVCIWTPLVGISVLRHTTIYNRWYCILNISYFPQLLTLLFIVLLPVTLPNHFMILVLQMRKNKLGKPNGKGCWTSSPQMPLAIEIPYVHLHYNFIKVFIYQKNHILTKKMSLPSSRFSWRFSWTVDWPWSIGQN